MNATSHSEFYDNHSNYSQPAYSRCYMPLAFAYLFLTFNIHIGPLNLLPDVIGCGLLLLVVVYLEDRLLRPLALYLLLINLLAIFFSGPWQNWMPLILFNNMIQIYLWCVVLTELAQVEGLRPESAARLLQLRNRYALLQMIVFLFYQVISAGNTMILCALALGLALFVLCAHLFLICSDCQEQLQILEQRRNNAAGEEAEQRAEKGVSPDAEQSIEADDAVQPMENDES